MYQPKRYCIRFAGYDSYYATKADMTKALKRYGSSVLPSVRVIDMKTSTLLITHDKAGNAIACNEKLPSQA